MRIATVQLDARDPTDLWPRIAEADADLVVPLFARLGVSHSWSARGISGDVDQPGIHRGADP